MFFKSLVVWSLVRVAWEWLFPRPAPPEPIEGYFVPYAEALRSFVTWRRVFLASLPMLPVLVVWSDLTKGVTGLTGAFNVGLGACSVLACWAFS